MKIDRFVPWRVFIVLSFVAGCGSTREEPVEPPSGPIQVNSAIIDTQPMPSFLPLTGSLVANEQSDVAANASGRVIRTYVERGSFVRKGDPLVLLDTRIAQLSKTEAEANLEAAEVQRRLADAQCERNNELYQKGAISRDEWEQIESRYKSSENAAQAASARANLARISLGDATVRATFSGLVGERFVSVGEYVQPQSKIASVVQITPLRLKVSAPEEVIGHITRDGEVSFQVLAFPNETFTGTITYIAPEVRPTTRDVVFEALVPNNDGRLVPGMFATATLHLPDKPLPAVPTTALRTQNGISRLFLIIENHLVERIVQVGPVHDGYVALLDGVQAGDRFVLEPTDQVKDDVAVH
jgi:membrane fusion protein, multidrug efflux system